MVGGAMHMFARPVMLGGQCNVDALLFLMSVHTQTLTIRCAHITLVRPFEHTRGI